VKRSETKKSKNGETETKETTFKVDHVDPKDLSMNADQINGGVVIDLIDDIVVSVQMPQIAPATYKRICLYQALEEYIGSESIEMPVAPPRR
jgi:hypothetical protein